MREVNKSDMVNKRDVVNKSDVKFRKAGVVEGEVLLSRRSAQNTARYNNIEMLLLDIRIVE